MNQKLNNYLLNNGFEQELMEFKILSINERITIIERWNYDYQKSLKLQKICKDYVLENRSEILFIVCSHPHLFTMGRGLQKGRSLKLKELVPFDEKTVKNLNFPLYKIKRGGGITFHYPGQFIVYPIVNLGHPKYKLKDVLTWLLITVKNVLEKKYNLRDVDIKREFFGVWIQKKKLASLGVGIEKFVTQHGLALNIRFDQEMFEELSKINPCGINHLSYACLDQLIEVEKKDNLINQFNNYFKDELEKSDGI